MKYIMNKTSIYIFLLAAGLMLNAGCQDHHWTPYDKMDPKPVIGEGKSLSPGARPAVSNPHEGGKYAPGAAPSFKGLLAGGRVTLDEAVKGDIKPDWTLYVVVRSSDGKELFGAIRVDDVSFPHKFVLTEKNAMEDAIAPGQDIIVYARYDSDGDPVTKQPGDLVGYARGVFQVGVENVEIVLGKEQSGK